MFQQFQFTAQATLCKLPYSSCKYICSPNSKRKRDFSAHLIVTATDKVRVK